MHRCVLNMAAQHALCEYFTSQARTQFQKDLSRTDIDNVVQLLKFNHIALGQPPKKGFFAYDPDDKELLIGSMRTWIVEVAPDLQMFDSPLMQEVVDALGQSDVQEQIGEQMNEALMGLMPPDNGDETVRSGMEVAAALAAWGQPR